MRRNNLALDDTAAPAEGVGKTTAIQWYGGPLLLKATGDFAGASVTVVMNVKMPVDGDPATGYAAMPDEDWIDLHTFNAPGEFELDNLNPCALAIKSETVDADDTRVKVIIAVP